MARINGYKASAISVVDFASWTSNSGLEQRLKIAQDLVAACRRVGFVYITNHGVPQATLDQAFAITKQLYDLPKEKKMKAPHPPGWVQHRGYTWPELEKISAAIGEKKITGVAEKLQEVLDCKV